jgi:hypothetical protein
MTAIFAIAIIVFLIARSKEQTLTLQRRNQKFSYYLLVAFNDFLRMFLVVMVLYHALLLFVLFSDRVSTGSLVKLEDGLARIESYCKMFKLRSQYAFLVLLAVYALGLARFVPAFTKYRDRAKKVYQFAALLCCFTLLGSQVGPPALTLAVQIRHNRHEFGVLRDSVRAAVAERVTGLVVQRIANGLPYKLFPSLWMLALAEFREVLGRNRPGNAELPGQTSLPFARDDASLRPIVLLLRSELFLVVGLCLASGEWLGNRQHRSNPWTKAEFTLTVFLRLNGGLCHSTLSIVSIAFGFRFGGWRGFWTVLSFCGLWLFHSGFPHDVVILQSLDELRLRRGNLQQGEGELRYVVPILEIRVKVRQSADFRVEHQELGLPIEREVSTTAVTVEVRLLHPLNLHLADGAAHPFGGIGLRRSEKDLRGGLREHDLGQVPIDDFQLSLALEAENEWVAGFAILGDGGV